MIDTQTAEPTADQALTAGLHGIRGLGDTDDGGSQAEAGADSAQSKAGDRATSQADAVQADNGGAARAAAPKTDDRASTSAAGAAEQGADKGKDTTGKAGEAAGTVKAGDVATAGEDGKPSRSEQRIRELVAKTKELEAKLAERGTQAGDGKAAAAEIAATEAIVPQPEKPRYTLEQLRVAKRKAQEEGNAELLEAVEEEIAKVRDYPRDLKLWEIQNKQAIERRDGETLAYRQEAVKKWPDLANSESPLFKAWAGVRQAMDAARKSPGLMEYRMAEVAALVAGSKAHAAEVEALKSENEKLKAEVDTLRKKMQPGAPSGASEAGSTEGNHDADKALTRGLREYLRR